MSAATVTDITTAPAKLVKSKDKQESDNVSISVTLPESLHERLMIDSMLGKKSINSMVEEWVDQNVSLQDVSIGLATLMKSNTVRKKLDPDVVMKGISISVSKRHYGMIKMEAIRQQSSITALLKGWIQDNVRDWYYEPLEPEECQERMAA